MKSRLVSLFTEAFAQTAAGMAKEVSPDGDLANDVKSQLVRVSNEAYNAITLLKKTYIDRKNLLTKIGNSMTDEVDTNKRAETKAKIDGMVENIDKRIESFDKDLDTIKQEIDIIRKNDI